MSYLFAFSFGLLLYVYVGYPLLVWIANRIFGRDHQRADITPSVTLIIPAYNEEGHIEAKLENSLRLDYPRERFSIVVADDGSTDETAPLANRYLDRGIRVVSMGENLGKAAMLARIVPTLTSEILVFSDSSSRLDPQALRSLVQSFADPGVGCVSGLYRLRRANDLKGEGEGIYWKYETFIKQQESRLHSILGAHGALYAVRRTLFRGLGKGSINDDFLVPMRIVQAGHRAVYDPGAKVLEMEHSTLDQEFAHRRRIAVGNCQQVFELAGMMHPRFGWVAFSFFSHKVLRTIAPLFMLLTFVSSFWLPSTYAWTAVGLQAAFYLSAFLGYLCQRRGLRVRLLSAPMYFCLGNLGMLQGLWKYAMGERSVAWAARPKAAKRG